MHAMITNRQSSESTHDYRVNFQALIERMNEGVVVLGDSANIVYVNSKLCDLLGYSKEELNNILLRELLVPDSYPVWEQHLASYANGASGQCELQLHRKDGNKVPVRISYAPLFAGSRNSQEMVAVVLDMTARIQAENDRLADEKSHRELLIREVHHRIKNNLQGVGGLLEQHAARHPELGDVINTIVNQLESVAIVHGLYGVGVSQGVSLCDMVRAISEAATNITHIEVIPNIVCPDGHHVNLATEEAIPVALTLNELICNAVKHGQKTTKENPITVTCAYRQKSVRIRIRNSFATLPSGFDYSTGKKLGTGLRLVRSLLSHAKANLSFTVERDCVNAELLLYYPVVKLAHKDGSHPRPDAMAGVVF